MQVEILRFTDGAFPQAAHWNQLLSNSLYANALSRTEVLTSFRARFAPKKQLVAVVARQSDGRLVAGLPLLMNSDRLFMTTAASVSNEWSQCGQLLVDRETNPRFALDCLLDGLAQLNVHSLWLDWVPDDRPEWQLLIDLAQNRGWGCQSNKKFQVGITRLPASWNEFELSLSKNSRKRVRAELKRLNEAGSLRLQVVSDYSPIELESALQTALGIELRSWKGRSGSAIACQAAVQSYFLDACLALHSTGNLRLFLLRLNDQAIAFDLGDQFRDTYRSWKVSYLPDFASYSPGHVLNQLVIKHFIQEASIKVCDSVGPMTDANRRWSNDEYRLGRVVLAPGSWLSNAAGRSLVSTLKLRAAIRGRTESSPQSSV